MEQLQRIISGKNKTISDLQEKLDDVRFAYEIGVFLNKSTFQVQSMLKTAEEDVVTLQEHEIIEKEQIASLEAQLHECHERKNSDDSRVEESASHEECEKKLIEARRQFEEVKLKRNSKQNYSFKGSNSV